MTEPATDRVGAAARATQRAVALQWNDSRVSELLARTHGRARRRRASRGALAAAAVIFVGLAGGWLMSSETAPPSVAEAATPAPAEVEPGPIRFPDGSSAVRLSPDARLTVLEVSDPSIRVALDAGGARFAVVPGLPRTFSVESGPVEVEVLGTVFEVVRAEDGEHSRVRVLRGSVRVRWPEGETVLGVGDDGTFPPTEAVPAEPSEPETEASPRSPREAPVARPPRRRAAPAPRVPPSPPAPTPAWVTMAEEGRYDDAAAALGATEDALGDTREDVDTLMLAADTYRLTGAPERALGMLDRAAVAAEGDPRAPLVAFTRGRLLLSLAREAEAADAFARARELAPSGPLSSDALAREVEARARAGQADAARTLGERYLRLYPTGLRAADVRRWIEEDEAP